MLRKKISILLTGSIALLIVAGCSGKIEKEDGRIEIRYASWESLPEQIKANRRVIEAFEKKYPGIKVNYQITEREDKIIVQISGGQSPDVFFWHTRRLPEIVKRNTVICLDEFINNDKEFKLDDFFPIGIKASTVDKKIYAVPTHIDMAVLFYNKDLFNKEGLSYPDNTWTWKEYINAGQRLTKNANNDGRINQFGIYRYGEENLLSRQKGIKMISDDGKEFVMDKYKNERIETLKFYIDLDKKYKACVPTAGTGSSTGGIADLGIIQAFSLGRVGMFIGGTWWIPECEKITGFEWDIGICPADTKAQKKSFSWGAGINCISKTAKHPKEAWEFVKFYSSVEGRRARGTSSKNSLPPIKEAARFKDFLKPPPKNIGILPELAEGDNVYLNPNHPCQQEIETKTGDVIEKAKLGLIPVEEAIDTQTEQAKKLFDEINRPR